MNKRIFFCICTSLQASEIPSAMHSPISPLSSNPSSEFLLVEKLEKNEPTFPLQKNTIQSSDFVAAYYTKLMERVRTTTKS